MRRVVLMVVATSLVWLPAHPGGVAVAAESSPMLSAAGVGPLGPRGAVRLDGVLSMSPATVPAVAGVQYLVGHISGTPGRQVQVTLNGVSSAPITLSGVSQAFGVTAPHPASGFDVMHLVADGAWQSADSMQVSGLALGTSAPNVTSVQAGSRLILLNGAAFTAKGYDYGNLPIGTPAPIGVGWGDDPAICQTDAALLGGAGATLIRIFEHLPDSAPPQFQTQCLDAFAANGVGVEFDLFPATGDPSQPTYMTEFSTQIAQQISTWKASPAVLFWELDNEVEVTNGAAATGWYGSAGNVGQLNTLASQAEAADPNHLVGTGVSSGGPNGCLGWIASSNVPALEFWGLHLYGDPHLATVTCTLKGTTAQRQTQASAATTRPIIVDEFGVDRYWCSPGASGAWVQWLSPINTSWTPSYTCSTPGSHEDQTDQASYLSTAWSDMAPYFASSSNLQGPFSGGLSWEYADQWWNTEASFFEPLPGTPWTHDTDGVHNAGALPGDFNLTVGEWFSVNDALTPGDSGMRVTTLGFDALEQGWLGATLPTVSGVSATPSTSCPAVTVAWTTSNPMSTQLDIGPRVLAAAGGQTASDSTYYMQAANDATLGTAHSVTLSGLVPGQDYQIAVRSFTSAGASVTTTPLDVTWTPSVPPAVPASCPAPNMPPFPALP